MRWHVNKLIATRVVEDCLAAGYALNIDNGGDTHELPAPSRDKQQILDAMFATDDEHLLIYAPGSARHGQRSAVLSGKNWKCIGWVYFIYCNSGYDVVSDYTTNLEHVMKGANELAEEWE